VIGAGNRIPWHLPADLQRFKALTLGHRVVMGRKTYASIGRPLPGRENVVVTRRRDYHAEGCRVVHSLEEALAAIPAGEEVFVIGGAELYAQSLPLADRIYLTHVDVAVEGGEAFFPVLDAGEWQPISEERHPPDARNPYAYRYVTYERRRAEGCPSS
jgi:dihydrofolate reductase